MGGPLFNRLHYVYQDSTVFFTWPAVRIQRFEHSLGCMHLAGQMFFNAVANADDSTLIDFTEQMSAGLIELFETSPGFCDALVPSKSQSEPYRKTIRGIRTFIDKSMDGDSIEELRAFSFLVPASVPRKIIRTIMYLAEGVRLAGMLHDLGHPPFSHVCEHVLTDLYEMSHKPEYGNNHAARILVANIDSYLDGRKIDEVALHEVVGNRLSELAISQAIEQITTVEPEFNFCCAAGLVAKAILNDVGVFRQLHDFISGTIDADRLDFVQRDSKASGIGADAMQYGRLIEGLRLMKGPKGTYVFALPAKALPTAEDFLRKRLSNYKTIVFHHRVVKSEELLESSLKRLAIRYFEAEEIESSKSDTKAKTPDSDQYVLPNNVSGLWSPLAETLKNATDAVLTFSQWNDSWLLTMLREEYTRLKIDGASSAEDKLLLCQLAELLYSEKTYQTVVKRSGDCLEFRSCLRRMITDNRNELNAYLDECERDIVTTIDKSGDGYTADARRILLQLRQVVNAEDSTNILRFITDNYSAFKMAAESSGASGFQTFTDLFRSKVKESLEACKCRYADVMVTKNTSKKELEEIQRRRISIPVCNGLISCGI